MAEFTGTQRFKTEQQSDKGSQHSESGEHRRDHKSGKMQTAASHRLLIEKISRRAGTAVGGAGAAAVWKHGSGKKADETHCPAPGKISHRCIGSCSKTVTAAQI